jgi:exoribonuclease II
MIPCSCSAFIQSGRLSVHCASFIDNQSSRDLDQVEFVEQCENGSVRVLIGIADVDVFVDKGSATDRHAFENTTSVYTGVTTFPILPEELSTNKSSLVQGEDRQATIPGVASSILPSRKRRWFDDELRAN